MDAGVETARINSLKRYRILDTAAERAFDDLTKLAATLCGTPISLVSLVDEHRQWFKSEVGLGVSETPRDQAFCAHAIEGDEIMVVADAHADARFADNPLVTDNPNIRFYAGAPLKMADGAALGTLCVIDREPRTLSKTQNRTLAVLRDAVVAQLELRRAANELRALETLVPICAWCRRVRQERDGKDYWMPSHEYLAREQPITHDMCPDCNITARKKAGYGSQTTASKKK